MAMDMRENVRVQDYLSRYKVTYRNSLAKLDLNKLTAKLLTSANTVTNAKVMGGGIIFLNLKGEEIRAVAQEIK